MKLLEKALYATIGVLAAGVLAFSAACSSPSPTPTPTPRLSRPTPTPTAAIQLQKPTAIPTFTPIPAAPNSVEISTSSCKRKIGIYDYSRTSSREGWEKVDGKLWIFGDCRIERASQVGIVLPEKFFLNDEGWFTRPYLKLRVGWEGKDYTSELPLEEISVASAPYTTYLAGFTFEIPKVVPSFYITFRPDGGTFCNIGDSCGGGRPSFNIAKYVSASSNLTSSQPNPKLYDEWFNAQVKPYVGLVGSSTAVGGIKLMIEDVSMKPLRISMKLENTSRGQDSPVQLPQIYFLSASGSILPEVKGQIFSVEKNILPPGYSTTGKLEFPLETLSQQSRYMMFSSNPPLILELK